VTKALTGAEESSRASGVGSFWHAGSSPLEMCTTLNCKKGRGNQVKMCIFRGSAMRGAIQTWLAIGAS
jgi:hypothetical protein